MGIVSISSGSSKKAEKRESSSSSSYCHTTSAQKNDVSISFIKCLYQAKAIVRQLENLHQSIDIFITPPMMASIQAYLDSTYTKFIRLCKNLLILLERMYSQAYINYERFESFKSDIITEWKHATSIRSATTHLLHHILNRQQLTSPSMNCGSTINNNDYK